jgi:BirA family biotin operon repressor/biotin-[acetyl-CoA-carboxylase] ligase
VIRPPSGIRVRTLPETGSTNDDVAALARQGEEEGLWLRADRQTGGKGRQGREWESRPGNLHASTLVRLRRGDPAAPTLALVAAVALHEAVSAVAGGVEIAIKWPNDLTAYGAKLSGILLERLDDAVVVGFGVNLAEHPDASLRPATSVAALGAGAPDPAQFLDALAASFSRWLARWRDEGLAPVRAAWLAAAHPRGTPLSTHTASGAWIEGLFDGLDESGALRLRLPDGAVRIVHAGDVFLI